jgi:hypothetical protein
MGMMGLFTAASINKNQQNAFVLSKNYMQVYSVFYQMIGLVRLITYLAYRIFGPEAEKY